MIEERKKLAKYLLDTVRNNTNEDFKTYPAFMSFINKGKMISILGYDYSTYTKFLLEEDDDTIPGLRET